MCWRIWPGPLNGKRHDRRPALRLLFLLIALGLPIALSIGLPAIGFMLTPGVFPAGVQISALGQTIIQLLFAGVDSFDLLAVPLFMLAGSIMETGGFRGSSSTFRTASWAGFPGAWPAP